MHRFSDLPLVAVSRRGVDVPVTADRAASTAARVSSRASGTPRAEGGQLHAVVQRQGRDIRHWGYLVPPAVAESFHGLMVSDLVGGGRDQGPHSSPAAAVSGMTRARRLAGKSWTSLR